jgi:hypothetical protein
MKRGFSSQFTHWVITSRAGDDVLDSGLRVLFLKIDKAYALGVITIIHTHPMVG